MATENAGDEQRSVLSIQRTRKLITAALYVPALAVLLGYACAYLDHAWRVVVFPYQVECGEVPVLNQALLLARGQPIYVDWSHPPYQMAIYTPLYPAVVSLLTVPLGYGFVAGRLLSFISTLSTGVL